VLRDSALYKFTIGVDIDVDFYNCVQCNWNSRDVRCINMFPGYPKFYSVTNMLIQLQLPRFSSVMQNYKHSFYLHWT